MVYITSIYMLMKVLAPSSPKIIELPASSNLLSVSVAPWQLAEDGQNTDQQASYIVSTSADRRLNAFKVDSDNAVAASITGISDSPILSHAIVRRGGYQFLTTMSGHLLSLRNAQVVDRRMDHTKYVVKVLAHEEDHSEDVWVVTAGWDSQVLIYRMAISSSSSATDLRIGEPVGSIKLPTNPESILLVRHPESQNMTLLVSRQDSTFIYYYDLEPLRFASTLQKCEEIGKQNLAPYSNAWVAFSPSCLAQSPHDPGLIAVALSTLPHMKIMIVRLLFPSSRRDIIDDSTNHSTNPNRDTVADSIPGTDTATSAPETQLSQAVASMALQNREDAAIVIQANTLAPQTAYSTPQVVWRPDGSGVFVNGDDGVIRGIEAKTGKLVTTLKNGHEAGSKVRSIWAGWVDVDGSNEEWVVSGGFDKKLIVWK
jgi:WD40 repeat protein